MRTIYDHKKLFLSFLFTALMVSEEGICQETDSSKKKANYSLYLYAGGGVSRYMASLEPTAAGVVNKQLVKPIGCFRVMWQTDHRLGLGIESGWVTWYSYESRHDSIAAKIKLTSVPLLVTLSMPIANQLRVFGGFGSYLMTSQLEQEANVKSKTLSLGWALAACYLQPLKKDLSLAYELKWYNAHETQDDVVSLQVQLVWRFLQW